jgi:ligand-binding sensor domain-containing protein
MNLRSGIVDLALLAAGCSGGAGTPPAASPAAVAAQVRGVAPRAGQKLYISNIDGSVLVYSPASQTLLQTITDGASRPGGLWVDRHGVLYAVNLPDGYYQTSLPEYKSNASSPFRTITDGIVNCGAVAVDAHENVYVTGLAPTSGDYFLEVYPKGKLSPSETLTIPHQSLGDPASMAFDSTGALLVGEIQGEGSSGAVYRLSPGSQSFTQLTLQNDPGGAIAVDGSGNLYVGGNDTVAVYAPNAKKPTRTFIVQDGVSALTVDATGRLYVGTREGISIYKPGAQKPESSFAVQALIGGLALTSNP